MAAKPLTIVYHGAHPCRVDCRCVVSRVFSHALNDCTMYATSLFRPQIERVEEEEEKTIFVSRIAKLINLNLVHRTLSLMCFFRRRLCSVCSLLVIIIIACEQVKVSPYALCALRVSCSQSAVDTLVSRNIRAMYVHDALLGSGVHGTDCSSRFFWALMTVHSKMSCKMSASLNGTVCAISQNNWNDFRQCIRKRRADLHSTCYEFWFISSPPVSLFCVCMCVRCSLICSTLRIVRWYIWQTLTRLLSLFRYGAGTKIIMHAARIRAMIYCIPYACTQH